MRQRERITPDEIRGANRARSILEGRLATALTAAQTAKNSTKKLTPRAVRAPGETSRSGFKGAA